MTKDIKKNDAEPFYDIKALSSISPKMTSTASIRIVLLFTLAGKPMIQHFLRCQRFAVAHYSFTLGRFVVAKRKSRRRGSCSIRVC